MGNMNVFRILGDLSHAASKCILIWAIHANRSAEGIRLRPDLMDFADGVIIRCITDHPDALRRCLHHSLPRPLLDSALEHDMELHLQELLYPLFTLHHLSHDESLCPDARKRKGVEVRSILSGRISPPGAHRHSHCPEERFQFF